MAFADPSVIKVGSTDTNINRVLTGTSSGFLVSETGTVSVTLKPGKSTTRRSNVCQVRFNELSTIDPEINGTQEAMISVSINRPLTGLSDAQITTMAVNALAFLTGGSNANLKKLIGGEN